MSEATDPAPAEDLRPAVRVGSPILHASLVIAPISLFVSIYLATFVASGFLLRPYVQWCALLSVAVATLVTIRFWEHGRFDIGFIVSPRLAIGDFALGALFAGLLILTCDGLIVLFSHVRQTWAGGFPAAELVLVFVPAALHEELAFRGYPYQKMRQWNRGAAIFASSTVFALLHAGNDAVSPFALGNIFLAGVLLALAYERFRRLWFPIGIHFAWNVISGPVLGFPVSGFVSPRSLLRIHGGGAALVTGGAFGVEASLWITAVEIVGIAILLKNVRRVR